MIKKYEKYLAKLKALSDVNRLIIVEILSCGELCACDILEKLHISQPTLSHHMKILCTCGLVNCRKDGKNMMYSLNKEATKDLEVFLHHVLSNTDDCSCK